jgi:holliday junction DNA helicase RuvB
MTSSEKLQMKMVSWEVADVISMRARGTPRIANMFLKRIRDYADLDLRAEVTPAFVENIIEKKLHTDRLGLRPLDHRYLRLLLTASGPTGVDTIASSLGEATDTIQDFVEPYLLKLGFIERKANGRWLTTEGQKFITTTKFPH